MFCQRRLYDVALLTIITDIPRNAHQAIQEEHNLHRTILNSSIGTEEGKRTLDSAGFSLARKKPNIPEQGNAQHMLSDSVRSDKQLSFHVPTTTTFSSAMLKLVILQ